jgi:hypothetical protein
MIFSVIFPTTPLLNFVFAEQIIIDIKTKNPNPSLYCSNLAAVLYQTTQKRMLNILFTNQRVNFNVDRNFLFMITPTKQNNKKVINIIAMNMIKSKYKTNIGITSNTSDLMDVKKENIPKKSKFLLISLSYWRRFLGVSVDKFKTEKIEKFSKVIAISKKECFNKTFKIIKILKARITHKNLKKGYLTAFDFAKSFRGCCLDSTEICIFIAETETKDVKVDIVSNNKLLASEFSVKFFRMLLS